MKKHLTHLNRIWEDFRSIFYGRQISLFLLFTSLLTFPVMAQNKIWDKTIGGNDYDDLVKVQHTKDGVYILGGSSQSKAGGDKSEAKKGFWLVKLNADGTKVWDK